MNADERDPLYPIGYFHIDIAGVQTAEGRLCLFVPIDRTSKFAFTRLVEKAGEMVAAQFLRDPAVAVACRPHTSHARHTYAFRDILDRVCDENGIEHRLTRINYPWTNGQING